MTGFDQGREGAADARRTGLNAPLPAALGRAGQPPTVIDVQSAARSVDNRTGWAGRRLDALAGWAGRWLPRSAAGNPAAGFTLARVVRRGLIADGATGQSAIPAPIPTDGTVPAGGPVGASAGLPVTAPSIDIDLGASVFADAVNQAGSALPLANGPATPASARGGPSAAGPSDQTLPTLGPRLHRRVTQPGLIALRDLAVSVGARAPFAAASSTGTAAALLRHLTERSAFAAAESLMRAPALPLTATPPGGAASDAAAGGSLAGPAPEAAVPVGVADGKAIVPGAAVATASGLFIPVQAPVGDSIPPTVPGVLARLTPKPVGDPGGGPVQEPPIAAARVAREAVPGGVAAGAGTATLLQRRAAAAGPARDAPAPGGEGEGSAPPTTPDAPSFDLERASATFEVFGHDRHGEDLVATARSGTLPVSSRMLQAAREAALPVAAARLMRRADALAGQAAGPIAAVAANRSIARAVPIETAAADGVGGLVGRGSGWPLVAGAAERARDELRLDRRRDAAAADRADAPTASGNVVPATPNETGSETATDAASAPVMAVGRIPSASAPPALVWRSPLAAAGGASGGSASGGGVGGGVGGGRGAFTGGSSGATLARRVAAGGAEASTSGDVAQLTAPVPTAAPVLDPELLAEQVAQVLARRFEIERERRGGGGQWR